MAALRGVVRGTCVVLVVSWIQLMGCFTQNVGRLNDVQSHSDKADSSGNSGRPSFVAENEITDFLGIFNYSGESVSNRVLSRDMEEYICGSRGLCYPTKEQDQKVCNFDCPNCKCDGKCHFYGDCCPDELYRKSEIEPSVRVEYITCVGAEKTEWRNETHIFMVTKCPNGTFSDDIVRQCQSPDITELEQATPVSDMARQIVYANKFCAKCHGIQNYQTWTQTVTCSAEIDLKGATSRSALWTLVMTEPSCQRRVVSLPPQGAYIRPCVPYTINHCNVTGQWSNNIHMRVAQLCHLFESPVTFHINDSSRSYRNPFCAVCNGESILPNEHCKRFGPPIPEPISVLLQFSPKSRITKTESHKKTECDSGQVFDPITDTCRRPSCPPRRILEEDVCEVPYVTTKGVGYTFFQTLRPVNSNLKLDFSNFTSAYFDAFQTFFEDFKKFLYLDFGLEFFTKASNTPINSSIDAVNVFGKVISESNRSVTELEEHLQEFISSPFMVLQENETGVFSSSASSCFENMDDYKLVGHCHKDDIVSELRAGAVFSPLIDLDCVYLEYNLSTDNFTFDPNSGDVVFGKRQIRINVTRVTYCNDTLKMCLDVVSDIRTFLNRSTGQDMGSLPSYDKPLQIVSFVCIILSLIALFVTFVIYCLVPRLRTAPGRNAMALVFHLFWAQLLFLSLSAGVEIPVLCQVSAILIHYFWLTTFAWMMASVYQMYKSFSGFPALAVKDNANNTLVWKYLLVCDILSLLPVGVCITYYVVTSGGTWLGYGGEICFISEPWAIGAFFAGPLSLMLLSNAFCFIRITMNIGCRPKIECSSTKKHANFVFIYIKLSLLFGFSWIFGLLAAVFDSDVLWYFFVVLTGSQGVFLFVSYCVNNKTWRSLKTTVRESSARSFLLSRKTS